MGGAQNQHRDLAGLAVRFEREACRAEAGRKQALALLRVLEAVLRECIHVGLGGSGAAAAAGALNTSCRPCCPAGNDAERPLSWSSECGSEKLSGMWLARRRSTARFR